MIRQATLDDIELLSPLFDAYRVFYELPSDIDLSRRYLTERMTREESAVLIAESNGEFAGFTQMYATYCSLAANKIFVLYDLYIAPEFRRLGYGKSLMVAAQQFAKQSGATRIDLETAIDNTQAQMLYHHLGYTRDTKFYKYSLAL